jgi:TPR repeat protein
VSIIEKDFHAINDCFRVGNFTRGELLLKQITEKEHHVYSFFKGVLAEKAGDINEARRWYREAADGWCKEALFNLGVFYEFGIGVICDLKLASAYYQRSGIMGDIEAQERFEKITCRPFSIPENGLLPISK